jgi:hypothetical protein
MLEALDRGLPAANLMLDLLEETTPVSMHNVSTEYQSTLSVSQSCRYTCHINWINPTLQLTQIECKSQVQRAFDATQGIEEVGGWHFKNPVSKTMFFVAFFSTRVNDTSNANRCCVTDF